MDEQDGGEGERGEVGTIINIFTMKLKKLATGNYFGYFKSHYLFAFRRPHGKWCCIIGKGGQWLFREGYHGTSLPTIKAVKKWAEKVLSLPSDNKWSLLPF